MPLPDLQKISEQAITIANALELWAKPRGGKVSILANQRHLWEALADIPDLTQVAPTLMVLWVSEELRLPGQPDCRRVDRRWQVVVVRGRGFAEVGVLDPLSGGALPPYTDSLEEIRDVLRTLLGISDEEELPSVRYVSMRPLPNVLKTAEANAFRDATVLEFTTANDIGQVVLEKPGTEGQSGGEVLP